MRPQMPSPRRHAAHLIVGAIAASSILAVGTTSSPSVTAAATYIDAGGLPGHVAVNHVEGDYQSVFPWDATGTLGSCDPPTCSPGGPRHYYVFYPHTGLGSNGQPNFDPWVGDVGGVHIDSGGVNLIQPRHRHAAAGRCELRRPRRATFRRRHRVVDPVPTGGSPSTPSRSRRCIPTPHARFRGTARSSSAPSPRRTAAATSGRPGSGWPGRYILFVTDTATGREIQAYQDLGFGAVPTIDLDAVCFGFDNCEYNAGRTRHDVGHVPPDPADAHPRHAVRRRHHERTDPQRRRSNRHTRTPTPGATRPPTTSSRSPASVVCRRPASPPCSSTSRPSFPLAPATWRSRRRRPPACGGLAIFDDQASVPWASRPRRTSTSPAATSCRTSCSPRRCGRQDPHLQLVGPDPHGRRRRRLVRHRRSQRQRLRIRWRHARPAVRQPQQHRHHGGAFAPDETRSVQRRRRGRRSDERHVGRRQHHGHRTPGLRVSPPRSRPVSHSRLPPTSTTSPARRGPTSPSSRSAPVGRSR